MNDFMLKEQKAIVKKYFPFKSGKGFFCSISPVKSDVRYTAVSFEPIEGFSEGSNVVFDGRLTRAKDNKDVWETRIVLENVTIHGNSKPKPMTNHDNDIPF